MAGNQMMDGGGGGYSYSHEDECNDTVVESASEEGMGEENPFQIALPCGKTVDRKPSKPCSVQRAKITDKKNNASVECMTPNSRSANLRKIHKKDKKYLDGYDMLYEFIGQQEDADKEGRAHADIDLSMVLDGSCSVDEHSRIYVSGEMNKIGKEKAGTLSLGKLYAKPYNSGRMSAIADIWNVHRGAAEYKLEFRSCGYHPSFVPNRKLDGLIRIYQPNSVELTLGIAARGKLNVAKSASHRLGGETVRTSSTSSQLGGTSNSRTETSRVNKGAGTESSSIEWVSTGSGPPVRTYVEDGTKADFFGDPYHFNNFSQSNPDDDVVDGMLVTRSAGKGEITAGKITSIKPQLTITHNGVPFKATETINSLLSFINSFKAFWDKVQQWVPQVGWSFGFTFETLSGEISVGMGLKPVRGLTSGRCIAIEREFYAKFKCTFLKCKAEISFGVSAAGQVAKILGDVTAEVGADYEVASNGDQSGGFQASAAVGLEGKIVLDIYVASYECKARVEAKIVFAIKGECTVDKPLEMKGSLKLNKCDLRVTRVKNGRPKTLALVPLFGGKDIWQGDLLKD